MVNSCESSCWVDHMGLSHLPKMTKNKISKQNSRHGLQSFNFSFSVREKFLQTLEAAAFLLNSFITLFSTKLNFRKPFARIHYRKSSTLLSIFSIRRIFSIDVNTFLREDLFQYLLLVQCHQFHDIDS